MTKGFHPDGGAGFKLPEVTVNKNGYTIRTDLIKYAKDFVETEFAFKVGQYQSNYSVDKDGKTTYTLQYPEVPGVDKVVEAAEKFYQFVLKNSR